MGCPKCGSSQDHIFTCESDGKTKWIIERCSRCQYAGWPDNPTPYADFIKDREARKGGGRDDGAAVDRWGHSL